MKNKRTIFPKGVLVSILIVFISLVVIFTLVALESQKANGDMVELWENIVLGILTSVVASVIFAIVMRIYSRNDSDIVSQRLGDVEAHLARQNELYDSGIKSIRPKAHFDHEDDYWNGIINGSSSRLDLIGHSLNSWFGRRYKDTFIRKLLEIVNSGGVVNIVLSSPTPDNIGIMLSHVRTAYYHEDVTLNKVEKSLLEFYRLLKDKIPEKNRSYLRVYITDMDRVTYFYIRTDIQCIISPYTYSPGTRENIFLLELCPDTAHVKILEDDFDEMIGNIIPVNFQISESETREIGIRLENKYSTTNKYKSKEWNKERTEKFVFRDIHGRYEAGFFQHFMNETFVKAVIELPVGYGCPSKCQYCASSHIEGFYPLDAQQLGIMFEHLYKSNDVDKMGKVLLSMTGMGDIYFNQTNVFSFLETLRGYNNLSLTLSSNFWTKPLLDKAVAVNEFLPIRFIQYTYVSDKPEIRKSLIDILGSMEEKDFLSEFVSFIKTNDKSFYRINYIVISGINDSPDDVTRFIDLVHEIGDKLTIRLSQLNETGASKKSNLLVASHERMGEINERMRGAGLKSYIFFAEKNDNMNCGQLVTESNYL